MRWLISPLAIQCHLLGLGGALIALFVWLIGERPASEAKWVFLFFALAYPTLLFLVWAKMAAERRDTLEDMRLRSESPAKALRKRQVGRWLSLVFLTGAGVWLIAIGMRGALIGFVPAYFIGGLAIVFAVLGAAGVNVWYGGPLDCRLDPRQVD